MLLFWTEDPALAQQHTTAVYFATVMSRVCPYASKMACLEALVRDCGADVDGLDSIGRTALLTIAETGQPEQAPAIGVLASLGANLNARNDQGHAALYFAARYSDKLPFFRALMEHGASADVPVDDRGTTALALAVITRDGPGRQEVLAELLRRSSLETRRVLCDRPGTVAHGMSALDMLVMLPQGLQAPDDADFEDWHWPLIRELLDSGVEIHAQAAENLLPFVAEKGLALDAAVALREAQPTTWRAHEAFVNLAFDFLELREAEAAVAQRERRVRELEDELRALGVGMEETEEEDEEEEDHGDDAKGGTDQGGAAG
jgi:hypothetical protein